MFVKFFGKNKFHFFSFSLVFLLILFVFRSLLFNIHTNLPDWNDYPLYVWIFYQNIQHIAQMSFSSFFDGNIFFPDKGTLLLSDLFIPQSLIALFISKFINNPITTFNIVYFLSWALNIISAQFFWGKIYNKKTLVFFAVLATTISSFTLLNSVHYQMINYWPYLFAIGLLIKNDITKRNAFLVAIWTAIQFYSGVYLGFFALFTIMLWYLTHANKIFSKEHFTKYLHHLSTLLLILTLTVGPLMYQYFEVKQNYNAVRDYGEYVQYSAHLTDYLFLPHLSSVSGQINIIQKWTSFNKGSGFFPGTILAILFFIGFFTIKKIKKNVHVSHVITQQNIFFTLLLFIGIFFSLGPRLNVNGFYTQIPLPYTFLLKVIPGFDIIRVTARWNWLFFIGIIFYSTKGLSKLSKNFILPFIFAIFVLLIELLPLQKPSTWQDYYSYEYSYLEPNCNQNVVLLEYPMTQDKKGADIVSNLTYRTQMMMATIHHKCSLINGYTGYIPKDYEQFESELYVNVSDNNFEEFLAKIKQRGANIFKLNKNEIFEHKAISIEKWLLDNNKNQVIYNDNNHLIISL